MGKNLISQARGKGGPRYRAPSFRNAGEARLPAFSEKTGIIVDIIKSQGHGTPLMAIKYDEKKIALTQAPEGVFVGLKINCSNSSEISSGNVMTLSSVPEGTLVFNIESQPGDGGRFCRSAGTYGKVIGKTDSFVTIQLPSKKTKRINSKCRAMVGVASGGGRKDKPFLKAGKMHYHRKAKNKRYPMISAAAQNAVDHPYGNKRTQRKAKNKPVSRHAPPGRKVGTLWPKRTGKRK